MMEGVPAEQPARVGSVLGRYTLVRLLGRGGMGAVYEAVHQDLGRQVALKTLHERYVESDDARRRFLREGQASARIRHPNVVDVYDVGVDNGQPYLVMDYLEGEDLRRLLVREGPLPVQRCADLLLPVVAGLAAAHDLGVVHRDLKPENVFLSGERGTLTPKVLDFGIAKSTDRSESLLTGTGKFLGTPYYVSPEQAQGANDIDARSDQYSLGVILYECCVGRRPIDEPSAYASLLKVVNGDFAPPRQRDPLIPGAFEDLILKAMCREASGRFPSTRALGRALAPFASARVRAEHAAEFGEGVEAAETARAGVAEVGPEPLGTTQDDSARQAVVPLTAGFRWRRLSISLAVAAVAAGIVALLARQQEPAPVEGSQTSRAALAASPAPASPALAASPAPATSPSPATPSSTVPPVLSAAPEPSALPTGSTPAAQPLQAPSSRSRRRPANAKPPRDDDHADLPPLAPR